MSNRPNGWAKELDDVVKECNEVIVTNDWDTLPSSDILRDKGFGYLLKPIAKFGSSFVREALGEKNICRPSGYWNSLDNILDECNRVKEINGWDVLPSSNYLKNNNMSYLTKAIGKFGFPVVRKALGEKKLKRLSSLSDVVSECNKVKLDNGWDVLPSQNYLGDNGFGYLVTGINKHKMSVVRSALDEKSQRPFDWTDKLKDVVSECRKVKYRNKWLVLPSQKYLMDNGFGYLSKAISKHKVSVVCEKLRKTSIKRPYGWDNKLEDVIIRYKEIQEEQGWNYLPSQKYLSDNGFSYLYRAIGKHGGLVKFRNLLNKQNGIKSESEFLDDFMDEYVGGAA